MIEITLKVPITPFVIRGVVQDGDIEIDLPAKTVAWVLKNYLYYHDVATLIEELSKEEE
mgnify:CR=1 FL=1|jgi:hypothetical protein